MWCMSKLEPNKHGLFFINLPVYVKFIPQDYYTIYMPFSFCPTLGFEKTSKLFLIWKYKKLFC